MHWVSKKGHHAYLTMATLTSIDLKMVFDIVKTFFSSFKFYIPFFLVATRCKTVDY